MIRACLVAVLLGTPAIAEGITAARLMEPTDRYGHGAMGPQVSDHGAIELTVSDGGLRVIRLPATRVFEDNAVRLADVTGDGLLDVVIVESDLNRGARLSVYGSEGLIAASPFIGQRNRWMAVAGIGDLDGDGRVEIAVVDRPHLRKTLVIWQADGDRLRPLAELAGVSNHRFGDADIRGGLRDCGDGPELVVARADWSGLLAVRFTDGALTARDLGDGADRGRFAHAMACDPR